jgi:hypothetical protein
MRGRVNLCTETVLTEDGEYPVVSRVRAAGFLMSIQENGWSSAKARLMGRSNKLQASRLETYRVGRAVTIPAGTLSSLKAWRP